MFVIRRIHDDSFPADHAVIKRAQAILREQFVLIPEADIALLPDELRDPMKYRFRTVLLAAEDEKEGLKGFALIRHAPDLGFSLLDFISTATRLSGRGIGGALYQRVREECRAASVNGLFFECLPDDPALCRDPALLKQNRARLKFYERFGARPIVNTAYETPLSPSDPSPPYLVFDSLGRNKPLRRADARKIVRAILERKYAKKCPPGYIDRVVESFKDDPVRLRPPRYIKEEVSPPAVQAFKGVVMLVVNDLHTIHHVRERGYVQAPVRISSISRELEPTGIFTRRHPQIHSENWLETVHDRSLVQYLKAVSQRVEPGVSVYPYVFPIRNAARPPKDLEVRSGYFCIDTFTPLSREVFPAAKRAVDCALTAAESLLSGFRLAYALVRPPGHHAERKVFGGFCYFNSAAIAAERLSRLGKVAVLDIDYHHGNGTQDIFYHRSDVFTVSIHGHPRYAYPYFSGFEEERGAGEGEGFNRNYPLPENLSPEDYLSTLERALRSIGKFSPSFLVVALGLDTGRGDPTGTWSLIARDFQTCGRLIGSLRLPTVVVQEGGYRTRSLGVNARHFFLGLVEKALS